jgi:hypothetical protein
MVIHAEHLIAYLNDPPARTKDYEAMRILASYLAEKGTRDIPLEGFTNIVKAHVAFSDRAGKAFKKSMPSLGPLIGGTRVTLSERWNFSACFYTRKGLKLSADESAAMSFFHYMRKELEDKEMLGRRWSPRLRICAAPRCGKFMFDTSVNRSRKTCSPACRMARIRAKDVS